MTTSAMPPNPLVTKLELFARLSSADKEAIDRATALRVRDIAAHQDIIRQGDCPDHVNLVLSGWACRYKQLEDGRRQILAYFLPGDLCDLKVFILKNMDHTIAAITPVRIAEIPRDTIIEIVDNGSRLARAFWWSAMVSEAIEREWIVNLGQRTAFERVGHLLCELFTRQRAVGLTTNNSCEMPLTQSELGDTTGLSTVHMNRTLQELRAQDLIALKGRTLTIPDIDRLKEACLFSSAYLHLDRIGREYDANEL